MERPGTIPISELEHVSVPIEGAPDGAQIIVVDNGASLNAGHLAMMQAMHSRSSDGFYEILAKVAEKGPEEFMDRFFVQYGHKSIGDLAPTTVVIEGVSMLATKAIQDSPLYNGQECSTRYIDFGEQPFVNPEGHDFNQTYQELRDFYTNNMQNVVEDLKQRYPDAKNEGTKWEKAIQARAFDILRGFLPAGASTNLAWTTNLRQASERLTVLRNHPLEEVRRIAKALEKGLTAYHPRLLATKQYPETEDYTASWLNDIYYLDFDGKVPRSGVQVDTKKFDAQYLKPYEDALASRPNVKTDLPKFLGHAGLIDMRFLLDFASFRDIQRHRAVSIRMPLHSTHHGFEPWYLRQLPEAIRQEGQTLLGNIEDRFNKKEHFHGAGRFAAQYAIPMGYTGPCSVAGDLPAMTYLLELRSQTSVHPTLRARAREAAKQLQSLLTREGLNFKMFADTSNADFDTARGLQDIIERPAA